MKATVVSVLTASLGLSIHLTGTTVTLLSPSLGTFVSTDEKATLSFSYTVYVVETFYVGSGGGI